MAVALLAGCTAAPAAEPAASSPAVAPSPSPTQLPPADAVKTALGRLAASTYTYTVSGDYWAGQKYRASGAHDPKGRKDSRTFTISGGDDAKTRKVIVIGDDSYENRNGNSFWMHADLTRLKPDSPYRYADPADPGGLARFTAAIHNFRRLSPTLYEGAARLEPTPSGITYLPLGAPVFRFKQAPPYVSYNVTTDARGDIASIRVVFTGDNGGTIVLTTTYSKIGQPVQITKPSPVRELSRLFS
ncbi:hypothetical protein SAMN05421748_14150 [Paractinoplanes atraurantiacus]|uniref:Uncharacterized protein n=1 Tax=Paractinoplanes atraurantiacus TaxID=1036182 RepID=A0A285KKV4_9ACTN|nr:hypothetical protein SAMN05421748_14150 [Actinoplanes atraurantiacus]